MKLSHRDIRERFRQFYIKTGHKEVPAIGLVPQNDPTTLFTGSGMQQFVPNLLGEPHPQGKLLFNIQPCIRAQDMEEIGDNRHTTFFEMIGNWSLGVYFKNEQLSRLFDFLINSNEGLGLNPKKLFVTVFKGVGVLPKDTESIKIWQELFKKVGVEAKLNERIFEYGEKNWWSRAGVPGDMPPGEPGGPDSEVFYDFGPEYKFHENSVWKNETCHPNCDCGRFMEICNSVFMEYKKEADGTFSELPSKNVDFGGGLERFAAAINNDPDVFTSDLFQEIIEEITIQTGKSYSDENNKNEMRVIADHLKAATFLIINGVTPSNKEQGYVLRRLLRRAAVKMHQLGSGLTPNFDQICDRGVLLLYNGVQGVDRDKQREKVFTILNQEMNKFAKSLDRGLKEMEKYEKSKLNAEIAFNLFQSYGFPYEISEELFKQKGVRLDNEEFNAIYKSHQDLSRKTSAGKFKGGLADHSEQVLKYHTATHLLHQALFDVLGNSVRQEGSNITGERLRFDFAADTKPTDEQIKKVESIINEKIRESLPMQFEIMPKEKAYEIGARSFFREKYPDQVKIYFIGKDLSSAYSKEFCGGPHVTNTSQIGPISIYKTEKIGSNLYRVYAK